MPPRAVTASLRRRAPAAVKSIRTRTIVDRFHRLYYDSAGRTWRDTHWLGVRVFKCPLDLWVYQELLFELHPDLIIETGTLSGGSAFFLASCLDLVGAGRVVTVDVQEQADRPQHPRITYLVGSSVDPEIVGVMREQAQRAARVMVILDSDHSAAHVAAELRAYAPLVTPGSYLIVEDTNMNGHPILPRSGSGPYEAVDTFLRSRPPFVRDRAREKYYLTFNPGGFLRRVDDAEPIAGRSPAPRA